jgi:DNA-binding MarR family transcriptional regulator
MATLENSARRVWVMMAPIMTTARPIAGLSDQPDHTMRLSHLAILANSELSRLSHLIRRLENRGLVRREADPDDGRFTNAILTPDGHAELVKAAPGHVELVRQLVFDPLTETDRRALHKAMTKLLPGLLGEC